MIARRERILYGEAFGIFHLAVVVHRRSFEPFGLQSRHEVQCVLSGEHTVPVKRLIEREQIVADHTELYEQLAAFVALVHGDDEGQWFDEMGRDEQEFLTLAQALSDKPDLEVLQVAQSAVDEPRGPTRGTTRDVRLLDEQHTKAAHRRISRDSGAIDTCADDRQIELCSFDLLWNPTGHGPYLLVEFNEYDPAAGSLLPPAAELG